jgi:hypothetical protein
LFLGSSAEFVGRPPEGAPAKKKAKARG